MIFLFLESTSPGWYTATDSFTSSEIQEDLKDQLWLYKAKILYL